MPRTVSVVIVSRGRPAALMRCLDGIAQLDFAAFEVITVTCPQGSAAVATRADTGHIKQVAVDAANISAARNAGIAQAAGEIVAFIDDDAVPEPLWLHHLTAPFAEDAVAATGGYVIGRNGISLQWAARSVDGTGTATPLNLADTHARVLHPADGRAIKTEGCNMAVRREVLAALGGFDPAFRFYLDETDLNMRLARAGLATALVPLARVHHGFAESPRRAADRTPRDLTEIGASQRVFLRKHSLAAARDPAWASFRAGQRARLLRLLQRGGLGADDVLRLMRGLDRGGREGAARPVNDMPRIPHATDGFRPYPGRPGAPRHWLSGRIWQTAQLRAEAARLAEGGGVVTLILLSPGARRHTVRFRGGVWEQRGGLFGASERDQKAFRWSRFASRVARETARVVPVRGA